jgi:hypothetical protein
VTESVRVRVGGRERKRKGKERRTNVFRLGSTHYRPGPHSWRAAGKEHDARPLR